MCGKSTAHYREPKKAAVLFIAFTFLGGWHPEPYIKPHTPMSWYYEWMYVEEDCS